MMVDIVFNVKVRFVFWGVGVGIILVRLFVFVIIFVLGMILFWVIMKLVSIVVSVFRILLLVKMF